MQACRTMQPLTCGVSAAFLLSFIQVKFERIQAHHSLTSCIVSIGTPLFPGEDEQEQLGCIMEVLGVPSRYIIEQCSRRRLFFGKQTNDMDEMGAHAFSF